MPTVPATEETLVDKESVNYREARSLAESCGNCEHFIAPSTCSVVKGKIDSEFVSDAFAPIADENADIDSFLFGGI